MGIKKTLKKIKGSPLASALIAIAIVLSLPTLIGTLPESSDQVVTDATVMITNLAGNSGGTGVVVSILDNESEILTNSHVCGLLKSGGKITTSYGESHLAKYYKQDTDHDLCLVVIAARLKHSAKIASSRPKLETEATISGHPNLLPVVVSRGNFTDNKVIQVFTGVEACTDEQIKNPNLTLVCLFFGGLPIIKSYETTVVTALIMPGSSGSAVYNSNNEVSGLVFAGSAGMSYAFTVPYDYVSSFLSKNQGNKNRNAFDRPDYKLDIEKLLSGEERAKRTLVKKCGVASDNKIIDDMCKVIVDTINWRS